MSAPGAPLADSPGPAETLVIEPTERGALGELGKRLAGALAALWVAPRLAAYGLGRALLGEARALVGASESIARVPGLRGVYCRRAFYRRVLAACGRDAYIGWQTTISKPQARLGDGVYLGRGCSIGWAEIGDGALLADGVQVLSGGRQHGAAEGGRPFRDRPQEYRRVRIGAGAWIGAGAIVMADVGEAAVVGAGAVVRQPVPAGTLAAGVPAAVVRRREEPQAAAKGESAIRPGGRP